MPHTRRGFLESAALAAALATRSTAASEPGIQVPKVKFGDVEISRLVAGCNQFYGFAHFNSTLGALMKEYYTPERICEVLSRCNQFGINAHNWVDVPRSRQDLALFQSKGGKMHLIVQGIGDPVEICQALHPLAIYHQGERTDKAWHEGRMEEVKEWCKKARQTGVRVGVGTHNPEIVAQVEHEGWDVDFYAGCIYYRTRSPEEWKKALGGESLESASDTYLKSDPPRMYRFMRQTAKPCFAFKILAAGRIPDHGVAQAFRTAFESIKPTDAIIVGMFPKFKDEVRENAELVHRILTRA